MPAADGEKGGKRMYYDATYILVLIGAVLSMIASSHVQSTYAKYSKVGSACGITGAQAARRIIRAALSGG